MSNLPNIDPQFQLLPAPRVDYSALVNDSFRLVKKHRALWIAGILATLLQGGTNFNLNMNVGQRGGFPTGQPGEPLNFEEFFAGTPIADIIANPIPYVIGGVIVVVIFGLIRLIFGTWAQAALISMANEADTTGSTSLGSGWRQARGRLLPLIGFQFVLALPVILLAVALFATLFPLWLTMMRGLLMPTQGMEAAMGQIDPAQFSSLFCMIPALVCTFIPFTILISIIEIYGFRSCLLAGTGSFASISRGWRLFRQQMGNTILTGVFALIAGSIVGLVVLLPIFPFWFSMAGRFFEQGFTPDLLWRLVPIMLYAVVVGTVTSGIVRAYFATLLTKLYNVAAASFTPQNLPTPGNTTP